MSAVNTALAGKEEKVRMKKAMKVFGWLLLTAAIAAFCIWDENWNSLTEYLVKLGLIGMIFVAAFFFSQWDARKDKKMGREFFQQVKNDRSGYIYRTAPGMKGFLIAMIFFMWACVYGFGALACTAGAAEDAPEVMRWWFGGGSVFCILFTLLMLFGFSSIWTTVYFNSERILIVCRMKKRMVVWEEIGELRVRFSKVQVYDRNGERLFGLSPAFLGYEEFCRLYWQRFPYSNVELPRPLPR